MPGLGGTREEYGVEPLVRQGKGREEANPGMVARTIARTQCESALCCSGEHAHTLMLETLHTGH